MVDPGMTWFSDDAAPELAPTLGRGSFVDRVWEIIRQSHDSSSSTVFGLVGPWGSGKSSILGWLKQKADADQRDPAWLTVTFNPWDYQDVASLQAGFFAELSAAFDSYSGLDKVRARVAAFGRAVAPFASLGALIGADASKAVAAASGLVAGDESTTAARSKLERALTKASTPVLVVVDDLDRVSADELLITLKLVRQLGRLPHVHYLLSYDETTILDVLTRTTLIGEQTPARARDYLEKVVQVRFDIPGVRPVDATRMMNDGLDALSEGGWLQLDQDASARFSTAYFGFMARRLNTPRAIKRYFAQIRMLSPTMSHEIDYVDFFILTWLRTFEPGAYSLLQTRRAELTGSGGRAALGRRDDHAAREELAESWRDAILSGGTRAGDLDDVTAAMSFLFPRFGSLWVRAGQYAGEVVHPRIASESYFDRYFAFGLAGDDIADATVRAAIDGLSAGGTSNSDAVALVELASATNGALIVGKLTHELLSPRTPTVELFEWLARLYGLLPAENDILSPTRQLEAAIALQLRLAPAGLIAGAIEAIGGVHPELMAVALDRACRDYQSEQSPSLHLGEAELGAARSILHAHFLEAHPLTMSSSARSAAWSWARLDQQGFREWVASRRERYGDLDALGFFVNVSVTLGTRTPVSRLRGFLSEDAGTYFNLNELRERFSSDIEELGAVSVDDFDGPIDTPQDRRRVALDGLRRHAQSEEASSTD